jgi:DNA-binding NarL/FixJ family response regulator
MIRTFARLTVAQHGTALVPEAEGAGPKGAAPSTNGHNAGGKSCPGVTAEELTILTLMANGMTLDSVAVRVSMSQRTLSRRLRCVCDRLGVAHPIQAIVWAARHGLI